MMSGAARAFSSESQAIGSPPVRLANSAAWSKERLTTCRLPMSRLRRCSMTCSATAPAPTMSAAWPFRLPIDALGEFHSGERNGHGPRADFGFRAHALAYFERSLEGAIENWAGESAVERLAVGDLELAENFGFAEKHGIEAGGDAEQMADGVGADPAVNASRKSARGMP